MMGENDLKPELNWPKLRWRVTRNLTIVMGLLAIILFIFPSLTEEKSNEYRILVAVLIILIPFIFFTAIPWSYEAMRVTIRRVRRYPRLLGISKGEWSALTKLQKSMAEYLMNQIKHHGFEIELVAFRKGKLYILIAKQSATDLNMGDVFEVIDYVDPKPMGQFKVTEIRDELYYAEGINRVDKLWMGYVQKYGETKCNPDMVAIHIPEGG